MKKIFMFMAAALVTFSLASCDKKDKEKEEPTPEPKVETVKLSFKENVRFTDYVEEDGWWQVMAQNDEYYLTLSNSNEISQVAGTYTAAQLDPDYSYVMIIESEEAVDFVDGSITLAVSGKQVTVTGKLTGSDKKVYEIDILYVEPEAKKTVNVNITDGALYDAYAEYGLYAVYGTASNVNVQLAIWAENGLQGSFTEEDLDIQYVGSGVQDADGVQDIFAADIEVVPGNEEGYYQVTADLLCYNNTLYKVNMAVVPSDPASGAPAKKVPAKKGFKAAKRVL